MRRLMAPILCAAFLGVGCDGVRWVNPGAPSPGPSAVPSPFAFAERYTPITAGDTVSRRATSDDPSCVGWPQWRCQYFRFTAPIDGIFEAVMTATGNMDLSVNDSNGADWWDPAPAAHVRVVASVRAGATYQMTVWEYTGGEFELQTSLKQQ